MMDTELSQWTALNSSVFRYGIFRGSVWNIMYEFDAKYSVVSENNLEIVIPAIFLVKAYQCLEPFSRSATF